MFFNKTEYRPNDNDEIRKTIKFLLWIWLIITIFIMAFLGFACWIGYKVAVYYKVIT